MLTASQLDDFDRTGIVKLAGAFSNAEAATMRDVVWAELCRRHGVDRHDRSTWSDQPITGMKTSKRHAAFAPIFGPALNDALDQLLGVGRWRRPAQYGQVLVTVPNACEWRVPHWLWHVDFNGQVPADDLFAVKYWALFDDVEPGGGGTAQLAGSHRLMIRHVSSLPPEQLDYKLIRDGLLRSHPWLRGLSTEDEDPQRNARFMSTDADIDGLPARVIELTGNAGDVYLTHPWVMHATAANARHRPRMMRSLAIHRTTAVP